MAALDIDGEWITPLYDALAKIGCASNYYYRHKNLGDNISSASR